MLGISLLSSAFEVSSSGSFKSASLSVVVRAADVELGVFLPVDGAAVWVFSGKGCLTGLMDLLLLSLECLF